MNQSAILAASLLAGFGLFIASRDRLPLYTAILWGEKPGAVEADEPSMIEETLGFELPDLDGLNSDELGKALNDLYGLFDE